MLEYVGRTQRSMDYCFRLCNALLRVLCRYGMKATDPLCQEIKGLQQGFLNALKEDQRQKSSDFTAAEKAQISNALLHSTTEDRLARADAMIADTSKTAHQRLTQGHLHRVVLLISKELALRPNELVSMVWIDDDEQQYNFMDLDEQQVIVRITKNGRSDEPRRYTISKKLADAVTALVDFRAKHFAHVVPDELHPFIFLRVFAQPKSASATWPLAKPFTADTFSRGFKTIVGMTATTARKVAQTAMCPAEVLQPILDTAHLHDHSIQTVRQHYSKNTETLPVEMKHAIEERKVMPPPQFPTPPPMPTPTSYLSDDDTGSESDSSASDSDFSRKRQRNRRDQFTVVGAPMRPRTPDLRSHFL